MLGFTVSLKLRVCISRTTTEVKCLLWPHGGSWVFRTEHHVQAGTHTLRAHFSLEQTNTTLPAVRHFHTPNSTQPTFCNKRTSKYVPQIQYLLKAELYCMHFTLTNILFEHVPGWKRGVLFFAERHRCVLRGRQSWNRWRRYGSGQWWWWGRWWWGRRRRRRRSSRTGCCWRWWCKVNLDRDVFRLLFLGGFTASGCRTDGGGTFRVGTGAEADDGQRLWGTRDWRRHPGLRSLQDVLALSLLEEYGRRRGKTVIIKSFQAHPDGNVKFEEYLVVRWWWHGMKSRYNSYWRDCEHLSKISRQCTKQFWDISGWTTVVNRLLSLAVSVTKIQGFHRINNM